MNDVVPDTKIQRVGKIIIGGDERLGRAALFEKELESTNPLAPSSRIAERAFIVSSLVRIVIN